LGQEKQLNTFWGDLDPNRWISSYFLWYCEGDLNLDGEIRYYWCIAVEKATNSNCNREVWYNI